ncbi:Discoidin domain-containing receptor 2 isoform 3 [Schistosoma japonicum]|uniref:Discoidin domain-containing receptor 2 isoform 3 n=1 Tax=Schistosoma japonicum TaxID=6182 RepID=A0A4Z2D8X7_SCHJA|nr:Discoidin domain-containing receptor 2 isoform 3 [Schistosoma japonicum]
MWINLKFLYTKQPLLQHICNLCTFLHTILCLSVITESYSSQVPNGVKSVNKDLGPLTLPPSAFSASSVYQNKPEYQPHKANFVVFASKEEISGAWCPAKLIHKELDEWLQIDFGALKLIKVLFSEGGGLNQNAFVPVFAIKYQREDNSQWYEYRMRNGSRLLHANRNSQTIAIQLDPPIIAERLRVFPYTMESNPKLMCLRLAIYGSVFNDGVTEYTIPEGDVYRLNPRGDIILNDTNYDGILISESSASSSTSELDINDKQRAYLTRGLGLLMDKQYFEGNLSEQISSPVVVGWFRRKPTTPSGRITMLFKFDQVRNFSQMRIHTLNSLDYIALFRRISVQFSNGGRYFDRNHSPVVLDISRDVYSSQPRWIPIDLGFRVGRYLRITLWFDYDWIVISEITFESYHDIEKLSPQITISTVLPPADTPISATFKLRGSNVPYFIAIICCCLGSFAFACFFAFMFFRLKRCRQRRLKKLHKKQKLTLQTSLDKQPMHQQLLLTTAGPNNNSLSSTLSAPSSSASPTSCPGLIPTLNNTSYPYNHNYQLKANGIHYTTDNGNSNKMSSNVNLQTSTLDTHSNNISHLTALSQGYSEMMTHPTGTVCAPYSTGIDQDGMLAFQLLQHGSSIGSNFSALNGLTLARRGLSDNNTAPSIFAVHPIVTLGTDNKLIGVNLSPPSSCNFTPQLKNTLICSQINNNNNNSAMMNTFIPYSSLPPPPPPDQPLPPLPNLSIDHSHHQNHIISSSNVTNQLVDSFNNSNNRLLINTSLSPVFPYTAASAPQAYPTENGFILSIDSPMPEYASASLFSGTGSGTISLSPNDLRNSIISKTTMDSDASKYKQLMETYCVPQHINSYFWPSNNNNNNNNQNQSQHHQYQVNFNGVPKISTPVSLTTASSSDTTNNNTQSVINNENLSESLDSSGMYYLTHKKHNNLNDISPSLIHQNPTLILPFSATAGAISPPATTTSEGGTHLIPIQTIGLHSGGILLSSRNDSANMHHYQFNKNQSSLTSSNYFHQHNHDENMKDLNNFTEQTSNTSNR